MRLEKSLIYKNFHKDLIERYGEEKAAAIWKYANEELKRLAAEHEDADSNSLTFVFPPVALYRAVEHYVPGEALTVTRAYGTKTGIRLRNFFRKVTALPGIPDLMWNNMDKEYMTGFRGIDYKRTKSVAEGDECCDYRLFDSRDADANAIYETDISDARWIAYDIPGNIGWMTYIVMLSKMIKDRAYGGAAVSAVPAALMITGVAELISERIEGLDRQLPKDRLYRGFGALTLGGLTGIAAGLLTGMDRRRKTTMSGGAALCAAFAGLLFKGYTIADGK